MCLPESVEQKKLCDSEKQGEQNLKLLQLEKLVQIQSGVSGAALDPPSSHYDDIKSFIF